MKIDYKEYEIELLDDRDYSTQSVDNTRNYQFEYSKGAEIEERIYPNSKHGIRVIEKSNKKEIASAIICENGGATTIHPKCSIVENDKIWICAGDKIYCLNIPTLEIDWYGRFDYATNFSIYHFHDDFVIHGELEIFRINRKGEVVWRFGGRDIFVTRKGEDNFRIQGNEIMIKDWDGYVYNIDENGKEIKRTQS